MAGEDRPAVSDGSRDPSASGGRRASVVDARAAVEAVWRTESARIVGALARLTRDFPLAEDLAQQALAEALVSWPREGVPTNPAGWLLTVGRRRAIDVFRRRSLGDARHATLAREVALAEEEGEEAADVLADPDRIDDDVLALLFIACHPSLGRDAQVALTLRVVGGLSSDEIARAFLVPTATVQARITRAKKALGAAGVPFTVPDPGERAQRLPQVLAVIYLIFTEGHAATSGAALMRLDLAAEARRLARLVARLVPEEPEAHGLLALLELTAARFPARLDPITGEPVLLEDQDRALWDGAAIRRGRDALATAQQVGRGLGPYGVQAAIAEAHAVAPSVAATRWDRIVALYEALERLAPSPVVALNRAVALSMAEGPATGLAAADALAQDPQLARSHLLPSVRGELLARLGRREEAQVALTMALERCDNAAEQRLLRRKLAALASRA